MIGFPQPVGTDWREWAGAVARFFNNRPATAQPVLLPTKRPGDSAAIDGLLVFNAATGKVQVSVGGAWTDV